MRLGYIFYFIISMGVLSCIGEANQKANTTNSKHTSSPEMLADAAAIGKVPTSIGLNFASGYWHIASGFNVHKVGDFREWDGTWLQMMPNHELVWGKNEEELGRGAWGWNDAAQLITFISDSSKEWFFGEWNVNDNGDILICIGNTPKNSRSTQFKLVRRQAKTVSQ